MPEMAASAAASSGAKSSVGVGGLVTRNLGFRLRSTRRNAVGVDGAPHGRLPRLGLFRRFAKPQNSHYLLSHETFLGDCEATWLTKD
jgi:hypothetical protein